VLLVPIKDQGNCGKYILTLSPSFLFYMFIYFVAVDQLRLTKVHLK
jgi:hypothetical protein